VVQKSQIRHAAEPRTMSRPQSGEMCQHLLVPVEMDGMFALRIMQ
jgi:hypothetical protein